MMHPQDCRGNIQTFFPSSFGLLRYSLSLPLSSPENPQFLKSKTLKSSISIPPPSSILCNFRRIRSPFSSSELKFKVGVLLLEKELTIELGAFAASAGCQN